MPSWSTQAHLGCALPSPRGYVPVWVRGAEFRAGGEGRRCRASQTVVMMLTGNSLNSTSRAAQTISQLSDKEEE